MSPVASLLDALAFLTRVPVPARRDVDLARAAWAFPVVGALVGAVVGGVAVGAATVLPLLVAAVLAVLAEVLLTGALHLDGLADCADGCGGWDQESRLRIMKDSSVGVYGVAAVVLVLLLRVALVHGVLLALGVGLPGTRGAGGWVVVVLTAAVWAISRAGMLPLAGWLPYARAEGTGRSFVAGLTGPRVVAGLGVAALALVGSVVAATLALPGLPGMALGAAVLLASLLNPLVCWTWARRLLGGVTGDVLGATAELGTLVGLVAVLAVLP